MGRLLVMRRLELATRAADNPSMCARYTLRRRLNLIIQELEGLLPRHPGLFDWRIA
jgi:hypothetical protein